MIVDLTSGKLEHLYRRNHFKRCGGTKSFSTPFTAQTNSFFFWAAVYTLDKINFFIQAFFEIPPRIAIIDIFMLEFGHFRNPPKMGKIKDLEKFLMKF